MASSTFLSFLRGKFWWIVLSLIAFAVISSGESVTGRGKTNSAAETPFGDLSKHWQRLSSFVTCGNGADRSCADHLSQFWDHQNGSREKREAEKNSEASKRAAKQTSCQDSLAAYGNAAANFIGCSVNNSRPILLCEKCVDVYLYAQAAFTAYAKTKDENGLSCDDIVYGSDLIEVVHRANSSIEGLWGDSHCAYCFDSYFIKHGTVIYQFSENLITFIHKHQNLTDCFNEHGVVTDGLADVANLTNASLVCKECYPFYKDLSDFFLKNYTEDVTKTCMDVVDVMNQTRRMWGHWFQCESRHPSMFLPWTVAIIIFATTIVFYIAMLFNTTFEAYIIRRQDRLVTTRYVSINEQSQSSQELSYPPL